jgi:hypothetical protein
LNPCPRQACSEAVLRGNPVIPTLIKLLHGIHFSFSMFFCLTGLKEEI